MHYFQQPRSRQVRATPLEPQPGKGFRPLALVV